MTTMTMTTTKVVYISEWRRRYGGALIEPWGPMLKGGRSPAWWGWTVVNWKGRHSLYNIPILSLAFCFLCPLSATSSSSLIFAKYSNSLSFFFTFFHTKFFFCDCRCLCFFFAFLNKKKIVFSFLFLFKVFLFNLLFCLRER